MRHFSASGIPVLLMYLISIACNPDPAPAQRKSAGAFPFDPARAHERDFRPSGALTKLSESLYLFEDTCNVYLVKKNGRGLLIGFGSGGVLGRLREAGVSVIDRVLVTHHHRNQAQGLADLNSYPFLVTVPAEEARYFDAVEDFWRDVRIYINYDCRSHWNTMRKSVRVDEKIRAGEVIEWQGMSFKALSTPGATDHAISYSAAIDGKQTVFCGDLLSGPGKVSNWFDLHWDYYGFTQGIDASDASFERIKAERPDRLLPAHGTPIDAPIAAMDANARVYSTLKDMLVPNELPRAHEQLRQILPHLIFVGATSYAILSRSGKAFLWDYGYVERNRVAELKKQFNVKRIDAASFSHYHDDHVIRAWELLWEDARIWIHESMLDVLEHPTRYRVPCLPPMPIIADRILRDGEKVRWEEYDLDFFHLPGQTQYHAGMTATIDGKKVMFTGDNTWNKIDPGKTRNGPLVPHNEYFLDAGFITCARKMLEYGPDLVCPAHTEEYSPTHEDLGEFLNWALRLRDVMTSLIDQPDPNFGMDIGWCRFYPYRSFLTPRGAIEVNLMVRNHLFRPARVRAELKMPAGMGCDRPVQAVTIDPKTEISIPFVIRRTVGSTGGREIVTADITINGKRVGEYAEAIIDPDLR